MDNDFGTFFTTIDDLLYGVLPAVTQSRNHGSEIRTFTRFWIPSVMFPTLPTRNRGYPKVVELVIRYLTYPSHKSRSYYLTPCFRSSPPSPCVVFIGNGFDQHTGIIFHDSHRQYRVYGNLHNSNISFVEREYEFSHSFPVAETYPGDYLTGYLTDLSIFFPTL